MYRDMKNPLPPIPVVREERKWIAYFSSDGANRLRAVAYYNSKADAEFPVLSFNVERQNGIDAMGDPRWEPVDSPDLRLLGEVALRLNAKPVIGP